MNNEHHTQYNDHAESGRVSVVRASCGANPAKYVCGTPAAVTSAVVLGWGRNPPCTLAHVKRVIGYVTLRAVKPCEFSHERTIIDVPDNKSIVQWDASIGAAVVKFDRERIESGEVRS